jgi:hypothetical protein
MDVGRDELPWVVRIGMEVVDDTGLTIKIVVIEFLVDSRAFSSRQTVCIIVRRIVTLTSLVRERFRKYLERWTRFATWGFGATVHGWLVQWREFASREFWWGLSVEL